MVPEVSFSDTNISYTSCEYQAVNKNDVPCQILCRFIKKISFPETIIHKDIEDKYNCPATLYLGHCIKDL